MLAGIEKAEGQSSSRAQVQHSAANKDAHGNDATATPQPKAQQVQGQHGPKSGEQSSHSDEWKITDVVQGVSAALSAAATVALAIFAVFQIRIYQRQTRVMDLTFKASARAVRASQRSARAAENALAKSDKMLEHAQTAAWESKEGEMRLERAYLFSGWHRTKISPYGFRLILNVVNYGKTPAFIKHIRAFYFDQDPVNKHGAHGTMHYPVDLVWAAQQLFALESAPFDHPHPAAFVGIEMTYVDIFRKTHFSRALCHVEGATEQITQLFVNPFWNDWD